MTVPAPTIREIREVCSDALAEIQSMQAEIAAITTERNALGRKILRLELALSCAVPILESMPGNDAAAVVLMIRASCDDVRLPRPPRGKPKLAFTNNDPFQPVAEIMAADGLPQNAGEGEV